MGLPRPFHIQEPQHEKVPRMKAAPNTKAISTMNDRAPRVVDAGKPGLPRAAKTVMSDKRMTAKQATGTGRGRAPQYL